MKPSEPSALRVVLDTQLLLRGAVAKTESLTARIYDAWRDGGFTLLLSEPILAEVDGDLLSLREIEGIPILDALGFWQRLEAQPPHHPARPGA